MRIQDFSKNDIAELVSMATGTVVDPKNKRGVAEAVQTNKEKIEEFIQQVERGDEVVAKKYRETVREYENEKARPYSKGSIFSLLNYRRRGNSFRPDEDSKRLRRIGYAMLAVIGASLIAGWIYINSALNQIGDLKEKEVEKQQHIYKLLLERKD